ncbi:MAG: TraR/DksA C4-type zinc finger protein [Jiangellales bacterium]
MAQRTAAQPKSSKKKASADPAVAPEALVVREDEDPWTDAELSEVRDELLSDAARLRAEIADAEADIAALLQGAGEEGGEDTADTGAKAFEREHEMALAASHREILGQVERALRSIETSSYGVCESCGKAIGKARLQAFPRATLCLTCKQRQERR